MRKNEVQQNHTGSGHGIIKVIGLGPGSFEDMTERAAEAIRESEVIVGYNTYISLIRPMIENKKIIGNDMREEVERCRLAIEEAVLGKKVGVVCSGDAGVYGMAGLILELVLKRPQEERPRVEIIAGVTSANACAAVLGAPLMNDFAVISLSDYLTPWELIEKRVRLAAEGDFVMVLYNPKSRKRADYLERVKNMVMKVRSPGTPVGFVRKAGRAGESVEISTLENMDKVQADMQTTVIIGNSRSFAKDGWMVTPRGYHI